MTIRKGMTMFDINEYITERIDSDMCSYFDIQNDFEEEYNAMLDELESKLKDKLTEDIQSYIYNELTIYDDNSLASEILLTIRHEFDAEMIAEGYVYDFIRDKRY